MKKIYKNILGGILFILIVLLVGSVISDITNFIFKNKLSDTIIFIINCILIFFLILILLKTKTGKALEESIFGKKFGKEKS